MRVSDASDWVALAEAGRNAWEGLSAVEKEELLLEMRFDVPCRACSDCTQQAMHREPHDCDCDEDGPR
jgi:hypothetical protein